MSDVQSWSLPGADGQPIIGDTHRPRGVARGIILIAHGFKGYKDYGMFPRIAAACGEAGFIAHRFNFSHSGMTNSIERFERPDLFEKDTWNKQVTDLRSVIEAAATGPLRSAGGPLPYFIFGHSRGGVTALLTAGRFADDGAFPQPAGVVTAAAPATACTLSEADRQKLLRDGALDSPSSRTGQTLRIGRAFLQEQLDEPQAHDVPALAARIRCPLLIIHGEEDRTVPVAAAHELAGAAGERAEVLVLPGGDHVFNTPNPMAEHAEASPQLAALLSAVIDFAEKLTQ